MSEGILKITLFTVVFFLMLNQRCRNDLKGRISLSIVITHILIDHLQNSVFVSKIIVFTGVIPLNDGQEIPLFPHNLLGKF
jgi:hypothetical protein